MNLSKVLKVYYFLLHLIFTILFSVSYVFLLNQTYFEINDSKIQPTPNLVKTCNNPFIGTSSTTETNSFLFSVPIS